VPVSAKTSEVTHRIEGTGPDFTQGISQGQHIVQHIMGIDGLEVQRVDGFVAVTLIVVVILPARHRRLAAARAVLLGQLP
jgi:hypothetical protein